MDEKDECWLGGIEAQREAEAAPQIGPSEEIYGVLKGNLAELNSKEIGLDGNPIEPLISYSRVENEKAVSLKPPVTKPHKEDTTSDKVERKAGILSSFLRELVATGTKMGWNNSLSVPSKLFTEVKGAELKETVSLLKLTSSEECVVFLVLKNDGRERTEKEQAIRDALLQVAFPRCPK